jgi:hypothetical protein
VSRWNPISRSFFSSAQKPSKRPGQLSITHKSQISRCRSFRLRFGFIKRQPIEEYPEGLQLFTLECRVLAHRNCTSLYGLKQCGAHVRRMPAIAIDPNYALAYSGLSNAYSSAGYWGLISPKEAKSLADAAARKAAELDDNLAEVHTTLAVCAGLDRATQEREYLRAIELNPSYADAHRWYSYLLLRLGRWLLFLVVSPGLAKNQGTNAMNAGRAFW